VLIEDSLAVVTVNCKQNKSERLLNNQGQVCSCLTKKDSDI
jgi:hypothetical protein